jgi:hypothetical protein
MSKFTRRELAAALSTSAILLGQPPASQPTNTPASSPASPDASLPSSPDDELKAARAQLRDNAGQLDKFALPMATEPATTFKP